MLHCETTMAKYCNSDMTNTKGAFFRTFSCSDKKTYAVKFYDENYGSRILPNEYVSGLLAKKLGLPCYELKMVNIDRDLLIEEGYGSVTCEQHLGIAFDENASRLSPYNLNRITNLDDISKILVFDQWIYNVDRGNEYSNLLITNDFGQLRIIDHSEAFGDRKWTNQSLEERLSSIVSCSRQDVVYFNLFEQLKNSFSHPNEEILEFISHLKGISDDHIEHIIQSIPDQWGISQLEKEKMFAYLIHRKGHIEEYVFSNQNKIFEMVG
ncbi:HipA family kinase [Robertmurraya sp. P23]|uniref:HipA family kinase n=1 Tax=Robertmurraya sp. P23 TaxID=3436931 RepID=UPI003D9530A6